MSNKKNNISAPFNNELSMFRCQVKQIIDEMPDDIFTDFCMFFHSYLSDFDDEWNIIDN